MSFNLTGDEKNHENQMSLFDFKRADLDFAKENPGADKARLKELIPDVSTAVDYHRWKVAHAEEEQHKTGKFMTMSMALHAAAILGIAMLSVPLIEQTKTETITIEIEDVKPMIPRNRGANVPATQGGTPVQVAKQEPPPPPPRAPKIEALAPAKVEKLNAAKPGDIAVAQVKPAPSLKTAAAHKVSKAPNTIKAAKAEKITAPKAVAAAPAGRSIAPKSTLKAVPMSIDDIEAPELDPGTVANNKVVSNMDEDYNEDFANVDRKHSKVLADEKAKMDAMAANLAAENDDELKSIEEKNKADSAKFAAMQQSMRKQNADKIAAAAAAEKEAAALAAANAARNKAARDAAARAAADAEARRQAQAQALAALRAAGGSGGGAGKGNGAGAGNNGSSEASSQLAGSPMGVRSLEQLRQMPGNPRPQYDDNERLRGDKGEIAFHGYVTKEGYLKDFRLLKSTGYKNLDAKTLKALKQWRFYPGQEGWVELPFRWDLKGGMQENGGRLRTSVGSNI